jgi:hypothetical protein
MGKKGGGKTWPASLFISAHFTRLFNAFLQTAYLSMPVCAHDFLTSASRFSCRAFIPWKYFLVIMVELCPTIPRGSQTIIGPDIILRPRHELAEPFHASTKQFLYFLGV